MNLFKKHYAFLLLLLFAAVLLSANLTKPFIGHHDWNGAQYSNQARNITRYGLLQIYSDSVLGNNLEGSNDLRYSMHYPPLLPLIIAFSFKIFGIHEWSARIVPLLFTLMSILAIYVLAYKFFNRKVAILASVLTSVLPITIYFGKMPVHEPIILPLALFSIYFYFRIVENSQWTNFFKLLPFLVLAHLTNWPAYYLSFIFFIHCLIFKRNLRLALIFPAISFTMFLVFLLNAMLLYTPASVVSSLADIFLDRLGYTDIPQGYSFVNFLKLQLRFLTIYFTKILLIFSLITIFWIISKVKEKKITREVQLLSILAVFGISHSLIFRNAAFIHDYLIFYLIPFIVLTSAKGFFLTAEFLKLSNFRTLLFLAIAIILIIMENLPFTRALIQSSAFKDGVSLGKIINRSIAPDQKALILSSEFRQYYEVFTHYYADRPIDYEISSPENLKNYLFLRKYSLIIAIPDRDTPRELIEILQSSASGTSIDKYLIFNPIF